MKRVNIPSNGGKTKEVTIKATNFQVIHFIDETVDKPRPIIIMYALGEDGIVYEFTGGKWRAYPINQETIV